MHYASKMFIPNPYIVRVGHKQSSKSIDTMELTEYYSILKRERGILQATWGYSAPVWEMTTVTEKSPNNVTWVLPDYYLRSYWAFSDDADALHFRLSVGEHAQQMFIWPIKTLFTIYEYVDV